MPDPIRGRWTLSLVVPQRMQALGVLNALVEGPPVAVMEPVEVVPVPDERAIERAAKALCHADRMRHKDAPVEWPMWMAYLDDARADLAAYLEEHE